MRTLIAYTDGACNPNPGPMGIGVALYDGATLLEGIAEATGDGTNNVAEYMAVVRAIAAAKAHGAQRLIVRSDSRLICGHINDGWACKEHLAPYRDRVTAARSWVSLEWIPREENTVADALSKRAIAPPGIDDDLETDLDLEALLADGDRRVPAMPIALRNFLTRADWSFDAFVALQSGRDAYSTLDDDELAAAIAVRHGAEALVQLQTFIEEWKPAKRRDALRWAARGMPVPLVLRRQRAKDDRSAVFRR